MTAHLTELTDKVVAVSDLYAARCNINRDDDWYALKLQEEAGELVAEYLRASGRARLKDQSADEVKAAMADEAADLLAQLLLFSRHNGIDLVAALERKWFAWLETHP